MSPNIRRPETVDKVLDQWQHQKSTHSSQARIAFVLQYRPSYNGPLEILFEGSCGAFASEIRQGRSFAATDSTRAMLDMLLEATFMRDGQVRPIRLLPGLFAKPPALAKKLGLHAATCLLQTVRLYRDNRQISFLFRATAPIATDMASQWHCVSPARPGCEADRLKGYSVYLMVSSPSRGSSG
jgi:hypothetical protein